MPALLICISVKDMFVELLFI